MQRTSIQQLASYRSLNNSTSLITLYIPGSTRYSDVTKKISSEISVASNIKSRITRQSVQSAWQAVQSQFKTIKEIPTNGIIILVGDTKEKFINVVIEPPRPVDRFYYRCDNKFHV